jgi:4'-phosphopantetheinyl transferase
MPSDESWPTLNKPPILHSGEVHVWRADLMLSGSQIDLFGTWLSEDERQRAERFRFPKHRSLFIARHGILRFILSTYLSLPPQLLEFSCNDYGKPEVKNAPKAGLSFSLSHTNESAVYAVTLSRKVGIDIEHVRSDFECLTLAKQFFASQEVEALASFPADQQPDAFFRCWTRKEAFVKAVGLGLSLPLQSFEVSLDADEPTAIRTQQYGDWFVFSLHPFPDTIAALAVEGNPRLQLWSCNVHNF